MGEVMTRSIGIRLAAVSVFFLVFGSQPMNSQSGQGPGTGNTGGSGSTTGGGNIGKTTTGNSRTAGAPGISDTTPRDIFLAGNVVTTDGSPLPEPVAIEQVCGTKIKRLGYTDRHGFFMFELGQPDALLQDVSETATAPYLRNSMGTTTTAMDPQGLQTKNAAATLMGCDLRGLLSGFQSTSVPISVTDSVGPTHVGTIVLLRSEKQGSAVSATSLSAPKDARKLYEKASAHIRKHKLTEAEAELERAVKLYPRYAAAWSDLGWLYQKQEKIQQASEAFNQARAADDSFAPPYIGLASLALRQARWAEARDLSARAMQLDGIDFPQSFYFNALANLALKNFDQAEKSARTGEQLDTRHVLPDLKLLLSSILAVQAKYAEAAAELRSYLKRAPTAANADKVQRRIAELDNLASRGPDAVSNDLLTTVSIQQLPQVMEAHEIGKLAANAGATLLTPAKNWAPPDIDEEVPPVNPGVTCPVEEVIKRVGSRAKELMENLQQFSANERIEQVRVSKDGNPGRSESASFKYVAEIREVRTGLEIQEHRYGHRSNDSSLEGLNVDGMAGHALLFHPSFIADLTITCEGLGSVRGQPAWQLRFAERDDRPHRFRAVNARGGTYAMLLKGRAWVTTDTFQVMRMETDLAQPVEAIALKKDHIAIDYGPVDFRKHRSELWLPQTVDLYIDLLGHRSHRRHSFADFELFSVDTAQQTELLDAEDAQQLHERTQK